MSEASPTPKTIQLPEQSTTATVAEVYASLKEAEGTPVEVDASQVQRLGAQVVQVLLAAEARWQEQSQGFSISQPSDAFVETGRHLGLAHHLPADVEVS